MSYQQLTYNIDSNGTIYDNDSIEASVISDIVLDFQTGIYDYIIITPSQPIEHSIYIQAASEQHEGEGMVVEIRFVPEEDPSAFQHYAYHTSNHQEIIQILLDYWGVQKLPSLANWHNITNEF